MSRLPHRFRTLRWRLTISYFVAAFVALMSLEGVFVVIPTLFAGNASPRPTALLLGLEQTTSHLSSYLVETPPDSAGLAKWLRADTTPIANVPSGVVTDSGRTIALVPGQNAMLMVVDASGAILFSETPPSGDVGDLAGIQNTPEARAAIAVALTGRVDTADVLRSTPGGYTVVATPISDTSGLVHGVLFLGVDLPALRVAAIKSSLASLLLSIIPFALIAAVLGTIFGLLTARGLTRRLTVLTTAADSWGRGDFAVVARDSSPDELGQLSRDLNRMADQVRSLLQDRQQLAVVEERNRLARDLHDSVKQQIFATAMQVAAARAVVRSDPAATDARLKEIERLVSEAQRELSGLIHELRPAALGDKGLAPALGEMVTDWSRSTGIAAEVRVVGVRPTALEVEQALFRVAQEALSNVARHSGATKVDVRVAWEDDAVKLAVRDDGHGFDVAERDGTGVGLRSMRERIEPLGGTLSIFGQSSGTRVEAQVPLPAQAEAALHAHSARREGADEPLVGEKGEARA